MICVELKKKMTTESSNLEKIKPLFCASLKLDAFTSVFWSDVWSQNETNVNFKKMLFGASPLNLPHPAPNFLLALILFRKK